MRKIITVLAVMILSIQICAAGNGVVDRLPVTEKAVAITIEGIDSIEEFERVLSICQQGEIHTTFFETSQFLVQHQELVSKALAQGNEFGNHGTIGEGWLKLSSEKASANFARAENILRKMTGKDSLLIKPPQAYTESVIQGAWRYKPDALLVRGIDSNNWNFNILEENIASIQNGDIISINMRIPNAHIRLSELIKNIKAKNYKIVSVSELASMQQNEIVPFQEQIKEKRPFHVVNRFSLDKPYLALTFDDGGSRENVIEILDILNEYGIHSTFFLTGEWTANNPDLLRRMVKDGHEIANHTYSHTRLTLLGTEGIETEIMAMENAVTQITGQGTQYVRPPYGEYNADVRMVVEELGFQALVMWDIDTRDWSGRSADYMVSEILNKAQWGSIVLFHLHGVHTAESLRDVIPQLLNAGYQLETIDKLNHL